ncbi:MAG: dephospho-CoA kinase [Candidatus Dormibacteraeota bacterium]|nr:dephospho-CoA kinase [Candidatus Dormibacteraeota bacterium]
MALTGGIASGKSTVAEMFRSLGARTIDADMLAREAVAPGSHGLAAVVARFGPEVLTSAGELDRNRLGSIVFGDRGRRAELETIVHPLVAQLSEREFARAREEGLGLVLYEIPLLFEARRDGQFGESILVYASPEVQMARLLARTGMDRAAAAARLSAQLPIDSKLHRTTWVIDNSADLASTRAQVVTLWNQELAPTRCP